jgi:hypothetical protein
MGWFFFCLKTRVFSNPAWAAAAGHVVVLTAASGPPWPPGKDGGAARLPDAAEAVLVRSARVEAGLAEVEIGAGLAL